MDYSIIRIRATIFWHTWLMFKETMCNSWAWPQQCWKSCANRPNIVALRFGDHRTKLMLGVVGAKVSPVSNFAQQVPTTRNNMQQGVQTDATCKIQQFCIRLHGTLEHFVRYWFSIFETLDSSFKDHVCQQNWEIWPWSDDFSNGCSLCLEWATTREDILRKFEVSKVQPCFAFLHVWYLVHTTLELELIPAFARDGTKSLVTRSVAIQCRNLCSGPRLCTRIWVRAVVGLLKSHCSTAQSCNALQNEVESKDFVAPSQKLLAGVRFPLSQPLAEVNNMSLGVRA